MKKFIFAALLLTIGTAHARTCDLHIDRLSEALNGDRVSLLELKDRALAKGYILHDDAEHVQEGDYVISPLFTRVSNHGVQGLVPVMGRFTYSGRRVTSFQVNGKTVIAQKIGEQNLDLVAVSLNASFAKGSKGNAASIALTSVRSLMKNLPKCFKLPNRSI